MSIWQSFSMISPFQWAMIIGTVALLAMRGPSATTVALAINLVATLAVCAAMDFGWLVRDETRDDPTIWMMIIETLTVAFLVYWPGTSLVTIALFAILIPIYTLPFVFGVSYPATYAIVNLIGGLVLAWVFYDGGDNDTGSSHRHHYLGNPFDMVGFGKVAARQGGQQETAEYVSQSRGG
jgi:hypothetical protein